MREDYDEYEGQSRASAISWMVMIVAALGFLALGWFAFYATEKSGLDEEIITLEAYPDAYKQLPEEKGGLEFLHQDKTIYDALDGAPSSERVEKLFPEPEKPVLVDEADIAAAAAEAEPVKIKRDNGHSKSFVAHVPASELAEEAAEKNEKSVEKQVVKSEPAPRSVAVKAPVPPEPKPFVKPQHAPLPVVKAVPGSPHSLQLGAFTSSSDAKAQWRKIHARNESILRPYNHAVVRADLPKGTFYRLRVTGFASKQDADDTCKKLAANKQACFYVKQ